MALFDTITLNLEWALVYSSALSFTSWVLGTLPFLSSGLVFTRPPFSVQPPSLAFLLLFYPVTIESVSGNGILFLLNIIISNLIQ